jgi:iron(III) transport system substrate-binding protein
MISRPAIGGARRVQIADVQWSMTRRRGNVMLSHRAALSAACGLILTGLLSQRPALAEQPCATPHQLDGFKTCADVAEAEHEGTIVVYTTTPDSDTSKVLAAFHAAFPRIQPNFVRIQAGGLYAKLLSERQAGSYLVDTMEITMSLAQDFQNRHGWMHYVSPEMAAYKPEFKSDPEGYWSWATVSMSGIAYNTDLVPADQAPRSWKDLLDPKWAGELNVKSVLAGVQHDVWYDLRQIYGDQYWDEFAKQKPRAFDSWVQQFERCSNGQDKIIATAQYSGYLSMKARGAPLGFSFPPEGLPVDPAGTGIVANAPHPQAARLFMDWLLGVPGQTAIVAATFGYSVRDDVPAPQGGVPFASVKLLVPSDWADAVLSQRQFVRDWNRITGLR